MARNENRRRKKLEAHRAKRKEQKKAVARFQSSGMQARMTVAKDWPVMDARTSSTLWEEGLGYVAVARRGKHNHVAAAFFLVDVYCLGVKDVILFIDSEARWHEMTRRIAEGGQVWTEVAPEHARKLVEGAVAYARSFNISPCREWPAASLIFGGIDATQCLTEFTFGKDGKPFYIAGPYDDPDRVREIMLALQRNAGSNNYDFLAPINVDDVPPELKEMVEQATAIDHESVES
jgi:hypothetical protein